MLALLFVLALFQHDGAHYPATRRVNHIDTIHGNAIADPYRWLENDRDPEVEAWVAKQAAVAEAYLERVPYRAALLDRLDRVNNYERVSKPWRRGDLTFFYRNDGRQNHSVLYVQRDGEAQPRVLIDPNAFSKDGTVALAFAEESPDGTYMAYGKTEGGSDWRDIYVMEIASMRILPDVIKKVKNSGVNWHRDGFFYSMYRDANTSEKSLVKKNSHQAVMYHKLGTAQAADNVIYEDPSATEQFVGCYVLENSSYLIRTIRRGSSNGNNIAIRPVDDAGAPWKVIYDRDDASFYPSYDHKGALLGTATHESPNGRVVRVVDPLGVARMETIIPERDVVLDDVAFGGGRMFLTWMKDVQHQVLVSTLEGRLVDSLRLPAAGTVGGFSGQPTDTTVFYTFTSHLYPTTIYTYSIPQRRSSLWKQITVEFDPSAFESRQVFVQSTDGARIPMTILTKRGIAGPVPTMLYGYGGFNISINPSFNPSYIPWLEQGCAIAIANLRGGGEYGEQWHRAGTRTQKQHVFDDAIACAQWLVDNGVTTPKLLALNGRSNGGLLVGAVINQRPDLFRVALPEVGVMDMLRFHRFTIGWNWQSDYGDIANKDEFAALYAYSPYHNLRSGVVYPSTMVMTADHDDRVVPAHSFKYAAMMQHLASPERPVLLRVKLKSGHGDVNRTKQLEGVVDKYSFMWNEMGFTPTLPILSGK
jgi:prolyl oligopeptidase